MDIDLDAVIAQAKFEIGELAARLLMANGQLSALQKHSAKQAEELAELRKKAVPKPRVKQQHEKPE